MLTFKTHKISQSYLGDHEGTVYAFNYDIHQLNDFYWIVHHKKLPTYSALLKHTSPAFWVYQVFFKWCGGGFGQLLWAFLASANSKTFNSFNINHKYTSELGNLFWKQQQKNSNQPAPNPHKITKTLTFIHTQILSQLLKHFCNLLKATKILCHFLVQCKLGSVQVRLL